MMLRCAIVGLGRWGQRLVDSCQVEGRPLGGDIHFTHAVVRSPDRYRDYCAKQGLAYQEDYQSLLAGSQIDAVVLATPHSQHFDQITAAAAAGKHVFVEKPFTLGEREASLAAESARSARVVLAVGHNRRFLASVQDLRSMIDQGQLGTITHMEGNFSGPFGLGYNREMWRANQSESPAGGMTAMGIHIVDAFIYLGGPIARVSALSLNLVLDVDMDDTTSVMIGFENGASGYLSTLCATAQHWRLQVFGTHGWAQLRDHNTMDVRMVDALPTTTIYDTVDIERAELESFARACQGGDPYPVSLEEAVHGIAVQEAIIESANEHSKNMRDVRREEMWHPESRNNYFPI